MSLAGQMLAQAKLKQKYLDRATKEELIECSFERHVCEDEHHHQYVGGEFLKDSWPRKCKYCGELLFPASWEPVEPVESDCDHETIGHRCEGKYKTVNKYPQECKHCGVDLKPKTWKLWKDVK